MGSSHSIEIPGGGTEGYHVLRVRELVKPICFTNINQFSCNLNEQTVFIRRESTKIYPLHLLFINYLLIIYYSVTSIRSL